MSIDQWLVKEVVQLGRGCGRYVGHLLFGIRTLKWNEIIENNARIPYESPLAQSVNVSCPASPPFVPALEDMSIVEKDFPDFRILRFESCEMVNNTPNRTEYEREPK
jgi:hypothetical protein